MNDDGWSPKELLARLSTKCPTYSAAPGGAPRYTMEDIAGALVGLPFGPYSLARVKYCLDARSIPNLRSEIHRTLMMLAVREGWKGRAEYYDGIAAMAMDDIVLESRCVECGGTGYRGSKLCRRCGGRGEVDPLRSRGGARRCHAEIKPEAWKKTWSRRYRTLMQIMFEWDSRIDAHLIKNLLKKAA